MRKKRGNIKEMSKKMSKEMSKDEVLAQQVAIAERICKNRHCSRVSCDGTWGLFAGTACPFVNKDMNCYCGLIDIRGDGYFVDDEVCAKWLSENEPSLQSSTQPNGVKSSSTPSNNGGSTPSQYALPEGAAELQDLIEHRKMNFQVGNIFKACYRMGHCDHSDHARDLRKILFFAERELNRVTGENNTAYTGQATVTQAK